MKFLAEAKIQLKALGPFKFAVEKILRPRWIVNDVGDLGLRVGGLNFWYYKWPDPTVGGYENWRVMNKREFGESIVSKMPFNDRRPVTADMYAVK